MKKLVLLMLAAMLLVLAGCPAEPENKEEVNTGFDIPKWKISESGAADLPALVTNGSSSNVTAALKAVLSETNGNTPDKIILMVANGMGNALISSTESALGDLILNDLPATSQADVRNVEGKAPDACAAATAIECGVDTKNGYLGVDKDGRSAVSLCEYAVDERFMSYAYVANGDLKTPFIAVNDNHVTSTSDTDLIYETEFVTPNNHSAILMLGSGNFARFYETSHSTYLNSVYKANRFYCFDFQSAIDVIGNDEVLLPAADESAHGEKKVNPGYVNCILNGKFGTADKENAQPNFVEMTAFSLTWLQTKTNRSSLFMVINDVALDDFIAAGNSEMAMRELKEFDEGVAAAVKYAAENPKTLVIVVSGYERNETGITENKVPVYAYGADSNKFNNVADCKNSSLYGIIKSIMDNMY